MIFKICEICGKKYETIYKKSKYCKSVECKKKAAILRTQKSRDKYKDGYTIVKSASDIFEKPTYNEILFRILNAYSQRVGIFDFEESIENIRKKWEEERKMIIKDKNLSEEQKVQELNKIQNEHRGEIQKEISKKNIGEKAKSQINELCENFEQIIDDKNLYEKEKEELYKRENDKLLSLWSLTSTELFKASGLSRSTFYDNHFSNWLKYGIIKKIDNKYILNVNVFNYDFLRLYHSNVVSNTEVENIIITGYHSYYFEKIKKGEIKCYPELFDLLVEIDDEISKALQYRMYVLLTGIRNRRVFDIWKEETAKKTLLKLGPSLFYLWLRLLFFTCNVELDHLDKCVYIEGNDLSKYKDNPNKLPEELKARKEQWQPLFDNVLIKAIVNYITKLDPSKNIDVSYIKHFNSKYIKTFNNTFNKIQNIMSENLPYMIAIDNVRNKKPSTYPIVVKNNIDSNIFKINNFSTEFKSSKNNKKIQSKRQGFMDKLFHGNIEKSVFEKIGFSSNFSFLFEKILDGGYVPGKKNDEFPFFTKNDFFRGFEEDLKELSIIKGKLLNGKPGNLVYLTEDMLKVNYFRLRGPLFESIENLHEYLDKTSNMLPMPNLPSDSKSLWGFLAYKI